MGFLDSLFGSSTKPRIQLDPDCIWATAAEKFNGIRFALTGDSMAGTDLVILVAHFSDTLDHLETIIADYSGHRSVQAVLASTLTDRIAPAFELDESRGVKFIIGERHPMPSVDDELLQFTENVSCRCQVVHHMSLDGPLMEMFAGPQTRAVMDWAGLRDGEPIRSAMVSRRIRRAQEKLAEAAVSCTEARSAEEWIRINIPKLS